MNNIDRIKQALSNQEFDAMLVINPINRLFATGFQTSAGALLVTKEDAWFFTDSRYIEAAGAIIEGAEVLQVTNEHPYSERIKTILDERSLKSIGFEESSITYSEYLEWRRKLKVKMIRSQKLLTDLRMVKSAEDLDKMIKAQRIAEKSFEDILPLLQTDITEKELA